MKARLNPGTMESFLRSNGGFDKLEQGQKPDPKELEALKTAFGVSAAQVEKVLGQLEAGIAQAGADGDRGFSSYGAQSAGATQASFGAADARVALGKFQFSQFNPKLEARLEELTGQNRLADLFPDPTDRTQMRLMLRADLREVPVLGQNGKPMDVFQKINSDKKLSPTQKERIFDVLAEVRTSYLSAKAEDYDYQMVNWKHTRGEIDQVLEASRLGGLSPQQTEHALLASIFSDSVKAPSNFITHNIDGAYAAAEVLSRHLDPSKPEEMAIIESIVAAVKEHQIGPPKFMGMILSTMIKGSLGKEATPEQGALVDSIQEKVSDPLNPAHQTDDRTRVDFTSAELALTKRVGVEEWTVPHEGSPHYAVSRAVVDGDSLINYASPDGWAKIVAIRGPETAIFFEDDTVFDSVKSAKQSYDDALSVISEPAKPLAEAGLVRTEKALDRVRSKMEAWFASNEEQVIRTEDGKIPFFDAPLRYPSTGELSPTEQKQFQFAKAIREKFVGLLRDEQGVYL